MTPSFTLPSFAKINWSLRVLGKRADGFHELVTVFQTVSLADYIEFSEADEISLATDDPGLAFGEDNLIVKAALALREARGGRGGARLRLRKVIPSPGGLGGGSSNAATALIGLAKLWRMRSSAGALHSIAAQLGSDVPFFLAGGTALGSGRGERIEPIASRNEPFIVVVTPDVSVSTPDAFRRLRASDLTNDAIDRILPVCRNEAESLDPHRCVLKNDFEESVFDAFPEIRRVKEALLRLGAVNAAMSGSGASVFAVFDNLETRQTAMKALDRESTWRKFAVATVSRAEYREALGL